VCSSTRSWVDAEADLAVTTSTASSDHSRSSCLNPNIITWPTRPSLKDPDDSDTHAGLSLRTSEGLLNGTLDVVPIVPSGVGGTSRVMERMAR